VSAAVSRSRVPWWHDRASIRKAHAYGLRTIFNRSRLTLLRTTIKWIVGGPDDEADLYRRFVVRQPRKVSTDHVIQMDGRLWEAPRGLGDSWVEVIRHVLDGRLWVPHEGRMVELAQLDPHANASDRRGRPGRPDDDRPLLSEGVPHTAASLAFDQDFQPLVDPGGGFPETDDMHHDRSEEDET